MRTARTLEAERHIEVLQTVFASVPEPLLATAARRAFDLAAGSTLCREGDPADEAWIVVSGQLEATVARTGARQMMQVGELIGESALLDGGTRQANVVARRDTVLVPIDRAWLSKVVAATPGALGALVQSLKRADDRRAPALEVVALLGGPGAADEVAALVQQLEALPGVSVVAPAGRTASFSRAIERLESTSRCIVLVADGSDADTSRHERAARHASTIVTVMDAGTAANRTPLDDLVAGTANETGARATPVYLHATNTIRPSGTASWNAFRRTDGHFHLRRGDDAHRRRVARHLSGHAVTLVLGGGGGRGLAEIGVYEELCRLGVPVDAVAGTSSGAVVAATIAFDSDPEAVRRICKQGFTRVADPTLPIVGLLKGGRLWGALTGAYGTTEIEDLWLPFGCVATDLTAISKADLVSGELRTALRASVALPGVFPPLERDGHLLVDGGIVDNLPVGLARRIAPGSGTLIAVDVAPPNGPSMRSSLPASISGTRLLFDRLRGRSRVDLPSLATTVSQSMLLPAAQARAAAREMVDCYLDLPMEDFRLLDFNKTDAIADAGAFRARDPLTRWLEDSREDLVSVLEPSVVDEAAVEPSPSPSLERARSRAMSGAIWLAVADLRFRLRRFVVAGVASAVTLMLLLLITGVVNQFDREPGAAAATVGATHWVLPEGIENPFTSNATFDQEVAAGVAAPVRNGVLLARLPVTDGGETIDAILVGHPPSGPGAPTPAEGSLATGPGVAVSTEITAGVGEEILLGGRRVTVTGRVRDATLFAGMPMVFVPIDVVRAQLSGDAAIVSAILTDEAPTAVPDGFHALTAGEVAEAAKGPIERPILMLHIVQVLLSMVAAMIIGAVVYLASIERTRDVAVFRAVGVDGPMLALGVAAQALAMALGAALVATALAQIVRPVFPLAVHLRTVDLVALPVVATVIAIAASYAAIRRTLRIDPSAAFAGAGG